MKRERAAELCDALERIALRLEQAEDEGRKHAADSLPGDLAKDPRLVDVFVRQWTSGAITEAVAQMRGLAKKRATRETLRRDQRTAASNRADIQNRLSTAQNKHRSEGGRT